MVTHVKPQQTLVFYVNKKAYERLPKDLKSILTTAIRMSNSDMYTDLTHRSTVNLSEMRQKYPNIKIRAFPTRILRKLSRETDRQVDEMVKDDALAKEIVESMRSYQEKSRLWTRISDQAFINNAGL